MNFPKIFLRKEKENKALIHFLVIGSLLLASLGSGNLCPAQADEKTIKFGIAIALSGPAAVWGISNYRSMCMGAWTINDQGGFQVGKTKYKWEPIGYDHKYIPAEAVKVANKAIYSDKVSYMCIHGGANALACIPLLKENNMLSLNNAGGGKAVTNPGNPQRMSKMYMDT